MNNSKRRLARTEKILFLLSGLLLSPIVLSTTYYDNNSCRSVVGERDLLNCYDENQQTIPLAKSRLPEGQELVDSYRCGTRLLHPEMTISEVNELCPASQRADEVEHYLQSFEIHNRGYYGLHYVSIKTYEMERWTFKDYGRFRTYVVFRDGVIYQIIQDRSKRN
ncbi:MAG: hypothetical protein ACKE8R_08005 [Methylophagaceae bacterium]